MLYDPGIKFLDLPDGVYPSGFTEIVVGKNGIERVFYVIGRGGLLEQPLSQELKSDLVGRITDYVLEAYYPNRELLRMDVEKLLLNKNYPEELAHARFNGHSEKELSDKCRCAMKDLFFCYKRNNGGLLKETKNALLMLIEEAEYYSLRAGAYPIKGLPDDAFKQRIWEVITKKHSGEQITNGDLDDISPYELANVTQDLNERNGRRWKLNERRLAQGLPLLNSIEEIIAKKMIIPDEISAYE